MSRSLLSDNARIRWSHSKSEINWYLNPKLSNISSMLHHIWLQWWRSINPKINLSYSTLLDHVHFLSIDCVYIISIRLIDYKSFRTIYLSSLRHRLHRTISDYFDRFFRIKNLLPVIDDICLYDLCKMI